MDEPAIQGELSLQTMKFRNLDDALLKSEHIEYDKSFDITQTLTPETRIIYEKALLNVQKQLDAANINAKAPQKEFEIYPTGVYPDDRINVQTLVSELGARGKDAKIIMKATNSEGDPTAFNFGFSTGAGEDPFATGGSVFVSSFRGKGSIEFIGEKNNGEITTVSGGFRFPGVGEGGSFFLVDRPKDNFSFKSIKFSGIGGGLEISRIGDLHVSDCQFEDNENSVIHFGNGGSFTIRDNKFQGILRVPIWVVNNHPECLIMNNEITQSGTGIRIGNKSAGHFSVISNNIEAVETSHPFAFANGIEMIPTSNAMIEIRDNNINVNGVFPDGIFIIDFAGRANNVMISDNKIEVNSNFFGGINLTTFIGNGIENICIFDNKISGNGAYAFQAINDLFFGLVSDISNVSYLDNQIGGFTSNCSGVDGNGIPLGCVDVFFDESTQDITFCGESGIVIDRGDNNTFTDDDCPECG